MSRFLMKDLLVMVKIIMSGGYRISNERGNELKEDEVDECFGKVTIANSWVNVSISTSVLAQLGSFSYVVDNADEFYKGLLGNKCSEVIKGKLHNLTMTIGSC